MYIFIPQVYIFIPHVYIFIWHIWLWHSWLPPFQHRPASHMMHAWGTHKVHTRYTRHTQCTRKAHTRHTQRTPKKIGFTCIVVSNSSQSVWNCLWHFRCRDRVVRLVSGFWIAERPVACPLTSVFVKFTWSCWHALMHSSFAEVCATASVTRREQHRAWGQPGRSCLHLRGLQGNPTAFHCSLQAIARRTRRCLQWCWLQQDRTYAVEEKSLSGHIWAASGYHVCDPDGFSSQVFLQDELHVCCFVPVPTKTSGRPVWGGGGGIWR